MDKSQLATLASQFPMDPIHLAPASIVLSSQHLGLQSVRFWWRQAPLVEWDIPPTTQHVVVVRLQNAAKLIYTHNDRYYEGPSHKGDTLILPAGQPRFWYVEGLNSLCIALDPGFVQRVALETCDVDPGRVELLNFCSTHDLVLNSIAQLFLTELRTDSMGGAAVC